VLQAKINGLDLQSPETAKQLGWTEARLKRVRRSLEPDRKWGQVLRNHFACYNPAEKP
jgi:hypothetical protein